MMMMLMMMMMMMIIYYDDDDDDDDENDPNETCKFRDEIPRIDKFSQPNSGGPQFQKRARGYIYNKDIAFTMGVSLDMVR